MNNIKKLFKILILCALFACLISVCAYGESEYASDIKTGDVIYFGEKDGAPLEWLVLDASEMNNGEPGIFLFNKYVVQSSGVQFAEEFAEWPDSMAQQWCIDFYNTYFTSGEMAAIPAVSKDDDVFTAFGLSWRVTYLKDEHVFFISAEELANAFGTEDGSPGVSAGPKGEGTCYYWLRSGAKWHTDYTGFAIQGDSVHDDKVYNKWGARPAMNLDSSLIMSVTVLQDEAGYEAKKLCIASEDISLDVTGCTMSDGVYTVDYTSDGAADTYLYLILKDYDGITRSSTLLEPAQAQGTVTIDTGSYSIPDDWSLYLCVESSTDGPETDYASMPVQLVAQEPEAVEENADEPEEPVETEAETGSSSGRSILPVVLCVAVMGVFIFIVWAVVMMFRAGKRAGGILLIIITIAAIVLCFAGYKLITQSAARYSQPAAEAEATPEPTPEPTPFVEPVLDSGPTVYMNGIEIPSYKRYGSTFIKVSEAAQALGETAEYSSDDGTISFPWRKGTAVIDVQGINISYLDNTTRLGLETIPCDGGSDTYVPVDEFCTALQIGTLYDEDTLYCTPGAGDWVLPEGCDVAVMMYHGTGGSNEDANLFVSEASLRDQFQYLNDNGYTTIFFEDLWNVDNIEKPVILTFDDGWANNYDVLLPLAKEYNIKCTIFMVYSFLDHSGNHMTSDELHEMVDTGLFSVQSHTMSHDYLDEKNEEEQRYELSQSRLELTREFKKEPFALAYPSGRENSITQEILHDYYRFAVKMMGGKGYWTTGEDPAFIYRYFPQRATPLEEYASWLESTFA